jgi:hypothetical protein
MARIFLIPNTATTSVSFTNGAIWQGGTAPTSGDEAHLLDANLKFDLTLAHSGIKLSKLVIYDTFKGSFGGSGTNSIAISFDTGWFHVPAVRALNSVGSPLININHGSNAAAITVYGSKTPPGTDTGLMPTRFLGSATSGTTLNVVSGSVGYGANSISESGACPTVSVTGRGAHVVIGPGITLSTVNVADGELDVSSAVTTLNLTGGTMTTNGDWQMGTATLTGGRAIFNHRYSGGTEVSTLKLQGATLDLSQKSDAFAATATTIRAGTVKQFAYDQFSAGTITLDFNQSRSMTTSLTV